MPVQSFGKDTPMFKQIQKIAALVLVSVVAACGGDYEGGVTPNPDGSKPGGTVTATQVAFSMNVSGQNGAKVFVWDNVTETLVVLPDNTTRTYNVCQFSWQGQKGLGFWVRNPDGTWWGCEDKSRHPRNLAFTTSTGRSVSGTAGVSYADNSCRDGSANNQFVPASAFGVTCP